MKVKLEINFNSDSPDTELNLIVDKVIEVLKPVALDERIDVEDSRLIERSHKVNVPV